MDDDDATKSDDDDDDDDDDEAVEIGIDDEDTDDDAAATEEEEDEEEDVEEEEEAAGAGSDVHTESKLNCLAISRDSAECDAEMVTASSRFALGFWSSKFPAEWNAPLKMFSR